MIGLFIAVLSTSYIAWYIENFEIAAVYPFDQAYATPSDAGASSLEERVFTTPDGERLIVWHAAASEARPTIVYFSGNAGSLKDRATRFSELTKNGFGLIAPAYRGSSGSSGKPEKSDLVADALTIVTQSAAEPLYLYGESLGAAVAIELAAQGVGDALVLEAPFTSLIDLVSAQYPAESLEHAITQRWNNISNISKVHQRLLVIHGKEDDLVPFSMGKAVFDAAASPDKTFLAVEDHGHTSLWTAQVKQTLFSFLKKIKSN